MSEAPESRQAFRWGWIADRGTDLWWYIGSALAGWLYIALVFGFGRGLADPLRDAIAVISLGDWEISLSLSLLVVVSWALFIDAPHVWATLARTFLDPDAWRERPGLLLGSLGWFLVGPLAILGPYYVGSIVGWSSQATAGGALVFFVFFRLWAYYHVVRQHWGFVILYKQRNGELDDALEARADRWFFNLALYLPLVFFLSAPWYEQTGMPSLGLTQPVWGELSIADALRPLLFVLYPSSILGYLLYQWRRWRRGDVRNGPKLLLLLSIVPLHLAVFSHPLFAIFVIPVVTVGHNLQYHRLVWSYGRNKYLKSVEPRYRWARGAFRSVYVYFLIGLLFTFACYQGPWVELVKQNFASAVDQWFVQPIHLIAGVQQPSSAQLGARVAASFFLGWAMQHYYLDAKIWKVRQDATLAAYLKPQ